MKKIFMTASLSIVVFLSGCGTIPQNPVEFREQAKQSRMAVVDTVEVKRPYKQVVASYKKYVGKCLNVALDRTTCYNTGGCSTVTETYNPTLVLGKSKMELYVQVDMPNAIVLGDKKPPKNGMYIIVTDAQQVDRKTTRLEIYRGKFGYKTLQKAIKGWATGEIKGCPDLTQG